VGHGFGCAERHHCDVPQTVFDHTRRRFTGPAGGPFYATPTATSVTIMSTAGTQTVSWQAIGS
jgi:hypothetical protein